MNGKFLRLLQGYQFGWFLGIVVEMLIRVGLGEDAANGFEDAVCSDHQLSKG